MTEEERHGVWRSGSSLISRIMNRSPSTVVRYMTRNRARNSSSCSGQMGSQRRRKSDTQLWFSLLMLFFWELEKVGNVNEHAIIF